MNSNLTISSHPLMGENLATLRDKNTSHETFCTAFERISNILILEASSSLPTTEITIETPITTCQTKVLDKSFPLIIAPILRAGLGFSETASRLLPHAHIVHIGMYRDENTHKPVWYYNKTPKTFPTSSKVFLLDPMLATGNSALAAIELFIEKGIKIENITFVSLISAPEGVNTLHSKFPNLRIITGHLDSGLNENAYIVPGLGDAGDRLFNSEI